MRRAAALAFITLACRRDRRRLRFLVLLHVGRGRRRRDTYKSVTMSGTFNKTPKVTIPKETGTGNLHTKTLIQGTGTTVTSTAGMVGNYVAYDWSGKTNKLLGSSYTTGAPSVFAGRCFPASRRRSTGRSSAAGCSR